MNQELSTAVNEFIILFVDGTKKGITGNQYRNIKQKMDRGEKGVEIRDFGYIAFHSISRMLEINEYYRIAPKEKPAPDLKEIKTEPTNNWDMKAYKHFLEEVRKGLENYLNSTKENPLFREGKKFWYQGTEAPMKLHEKLTNKIYNLE